MKAIVTLLFVLTIGALALANIEENHVKVNRLEMGFVLDCSTNRVINTKKVEFTTDKKVVRLYRRENVRITRALEFSTQRSRTILV